ncbi:MAG TPA: DUF4142 domain-containing protein [Phycisphaerae bacterium]
MRTKIYFLALSLAALTPALLAIDLPAPPDDLAKQDQQFLSDACSTLTTETHVSALAVKQSRDPEITAFAQRMAGEDEFLTLQIRSLAQQEHLDLPEKIKSQDDELLANLGKLNPGDFDKEYVRLILERQSHAVYLFDTASRNAALSEVDGWARRNDEAMRDQLGSLQRIASKAGIASAAAEP